MGGITKRTAAAERAIEYLIDRRSGRGPIGGLERGVKRESGKMGHTSLSVLGSRNPSAQVGGENMPVG